LPGGTEENHEIPHSGYAVSRPGFELGALRIFKIANNNNNNNNK
jgi:hypothetical protein